jgi:hypothetical protein
MGEDVKGYHAKPPNLSTTIAGYWIECTIQAAAAPTNLAGVPGTSSKQSSIHFGLVDVTRLVGITATTGPVLKQEGVARAVVQKSRRCE